MIYSMFFNQIILNLIAKCYCVNTNRNKLNVYPIAQRDMNWYIVYSICIGCWTASEEGEGASVDIENLKFVVL